MNAFALIDKPRGLTSFDVVARVRKVVHERSVGHTGTLDPMATGLLVIAIGEATKLMPLFEGDDKTYDAELLLGVTTNTGDADGHVTAEAAVPKLSRARLEEVRRTFCGEILQVPPMVSALRQGGRRLYALAREGKEVDRPARRVTVHEFAFNAVETPRLSFCARVSKGTYIRTLASDIGTALGCGAHLTSLRRLRAGFVSLDDAQTLDAFEASPHLLAPIDVAGRYRAVHLTSPQVAEIRQGRAIRDFTPVLPDRPSGDTPLVLIDPAGAVMGLAEIVSGRGLQPRRLLNLGTSESDC